MPANADDLRLLNELANHEAGKLPWAQMGTRDQVKLEELVVRGFAVPVGSSATGNYYHITANGLLELQMAGEVKKPPSANHAALLALARAAKARADAARPWHETKFLLDYIYSALADVPALADAVERLVAENERLRTVDDAATTLARADAERPWVQLINKLCDAKDAEIAALRAENADYAKHLGEIP